MGLVKGGKVKLASKTAPVCPNPDCGAPLMPQLRYCQVCETDIGYPNVRKCETRVELDGLQKRVVAAKAAANAKNTLEVVNKFEVEMEKSVAIICQDISKLVRILESDNQFYVSYYKVRDSGERGPEDNIWDSTRESGDALIFPDYHKEIIFAALSLDERGVEAYGNTRMILKESAISKRASVFDTNTFYFVASLGLSSGKVVPPGYRATWADRPRLAVAKLATVFEQTDEVQDFPKRLLASVDDRAGDFIEVHVYGRINRRAVAKVIVSTKTMRKVDAMLARSLRTKLKGTGIALEIEA